MPLHQRFETLLLFDPNHSPVTANVWISHPSPAEELALGKLVVVSTIAGKDRVNQDIISLVQEELRSNYYQAVDTKPERAFEQALHQTNKRMHQVTTDSVKSWIDQSSMLVAAVWRETLVLSSFGSIQVHLLRRNSRDSQSTMAMHSILGADHLPVNPVRIFAHTISGQLQADDQVLICTSTLLDYFSLEKLRRTLVDGRPEEAIHHWETTLLGVEQRSAFAAVIIQTQSFDQVTIPSSRPVIQSTLVNSAPQVSMDHLIAREEATKRLLSPSIWPAIRDLVIQIWQLLDRIFRRVVLRKPTRRALPLGLHHPPSPLPIRTSFWPIFRRTLATWFSNFGQLFSSIIPRRVEVQRAPTMNLSPVLRKRWRPSLNRLVWWFQQLSRRQQGLMVASILLLCIIAAATFPRTSTPTSTTDVTTNQNSFDQSITRAKAALLYGGEETAQQNLATARLFYEKLPKRSAQDKANRQAALTNINEVALRLAKRTTIVNPTVVAQLSTIAPLALPRQLYLVGSQLISHDPEHFITLASSLTEKQATSVIPNTLDIGTPLTGTVTSTSSIIFSTDRRGFVKLDTVKNIWKPIESAWPTKQPRVQSIASYQNRVYALIPNENTIIRFTLSANSLGTGSNWLKESSDLSSSRGLAVDGSIYILQPHGVVDMYTNGRLGVFALTTIEPPLTDASRLWTDVSSTKLYLVDPDQKRIVVYNKSGLLLHQYDSSSWESLRDIAIDEKNKMAYVLSGTTITSFTLLQ